MWSWCCIGFGRGFLNEMCWRFHDFVEVTFVDLSPADDMG